MKIKDFMRKRSPISCETLNIENGGGTITMYRYMMQSVCLVRAHKDLGLYYYPLRDSNNPPSLQTIGADTATTTERREMKYGITHCRAFCASPHGGFHTCIIRARLNAGCGQQSITTER